MTAREETDKILKGIERRIRKEYKQANVEVQAKLDDYLRRFAIKDKTKRHQVAIGRITQEEYQQWLTGQVMMGKRWEEMRDTLAEDYKNVHDIARSIAIQHMPDVYCLNHNWATYEVEMASGVDTSYTLYNRYAVERIFRSDVKIYKDPGARTEQAIREGRIRRWNKQQIESVITQGILQGEGIPDLARRLNKVSDSGFKASIRDARTITTAVENAGHLDAYSRCERMGVELEQQWLATVDDRTRHSHRELNGETIRIGEEFSNGLQYPGDPSGPPGEVYNCRCTLIANVLGHRRDIEEMGRARLREHGYESYEEWKAATPVYNPITRPVEVAEAMRMRYIREDYLGF